MARNYQMASEQLHAVLADTGVAVAIKTTDGLADRVLLDRFVKHRDETAFAALVARHGGMVLGICRRTLRHAHDAEDACQATFLVLARKAGAIRKMESLPSWLHGVAYHVATNLRRDMARRNAREASLTEPFGADAPADISQREAQAVLDEELARLPAKYRAPLVLCYLEGKTRDEAAQELGWSLGTLKGRLERGRELLRRRLTRRGLTFSAALLSTLLTQSSASATASPVLVLSIVRAGLLYAAGKAATAGGISLRVAALAKSVLNALLLAKLKAAGGVLAVVLAVGAGTSLISISRSAAPPNPTQLGDWPGWRGPTAMGYTQDNDLPLTWGGKNHENILWTARIDGWRDIEAYSSPIVSRDRVFVTAATAKRETGLPKNPPQQWVACYRVSDGKQLWETLIPPGPWLAIDGHDGYAVPTPVTDG